MRSVALLGLLLGGCASATVTKVKPCDYETKGFRYYMPRPYLTVKKPFPVGGIQAIVSGTVSDGNVTNIDLSTLPAEVKRRLGVSDVASTGTLPLGQVLVSVDDTPIVPRLVSEQSGDVESASDEVVAGPDWLTATVSPAILQADKQDFSISATLLKDKHPFTAIAQVEIGLVPIGDDNKPKTGSFLAMIPQNIATFATGTALPYTALGLREKLKGYSSYTAALRIRGTQAGVADKTYLVHALGTSLAVMAAAKDKNEGKQEEKIKESEAKTKANVRIAGNPATNPLQQVNDYFDVLYLPDFDEQYAVRVKPGLGRADLELGLENGWMAESASISLDNQQLGEFVFSQIEKVVDLGVELVKVKHGLLAPVTTEEPAAEQALDQKQVVMKLTYVREAQPGLYPILKPAEQGAIAADSTSNPWLYLPTRPYTVVAFQTTESLVIELLTPVPSGGSSQGGGHVQTVSVSDVQSVLRAISNNLTGPANQTVKNVVDKVVQNLQSAKVKSKILYLEVDPSLTTQEAQTAGSVLMSKVADFNAKFPTVEISGIQFDAPPTN